MSIESLRLECVLERSVDRVAKAVVSVLRREGWRPAGDEQHPRAREIRVARKKGWVVVDELDREGTEVSWVRNITRELGCMGIWMGASPDFDSFAIERWLAGEGKGRASFDGSSGLRKPARLKVAFLTDLVHDAATRGRFARGLDVSNSQSMATFYQIAREAGLPRPMARSEELDRAQVLRFLPPLRVRRQRKVTVRFETSFHVRGVEGSVVIEALRTILKRKRRSASKSKNPSRQLFVCAAASWISFGEAVNDDPLVIRWGKALSTQLGVDVLEVWVDGENAACLLTWRDGKEASRVTLPNDWVRTDPNDPTRLSLATDALAPFQPKCKIVRLGSHEFALAMWVGAVRAMVVALGESIELSHPILEGSYEGTVLGFAR